MMVEISASDIKSNSTSIYQLLEAGKIVVIRKVPEIFLLKQIIINYVYRLSGESLKNEVLRILDRKIIGLEKAIYNLVRAIREIRKNRLLSVLLAELVQSCGFPHPVVIGGEAHRLVLPNKTLQHLESSSELFEYLDFIGRISPDELTETFMMNPAPPHRDINQPHYNFQANFWFPLHDTNDRETLLIFPEVYQNPFLPQLPKLENGEYPEPEKWGVGAPLRISLNFGDLIAFHSEHYHGSPTEKPESFRLSYDFRIASGVYDDNGGYTKDFSNIYNFLPMQNMPDKNGISEQYWNRLSERIATFIMYAQNPPIAVKSHFVNNQNVAIAHQYYSCLPENQPNISIDFIKENLYIFKFFPFAEDRYLKLAKLCPDEELKSEIIHIVMNRSNSYFWILQCCELALKMKDLDLAKNGFEKVIEFARETQLSFERNPINYNKKSEDTSFQILPHKAIELAEYYLKNLGNDRLMIKLSLTNPLLIVEYNGYNIVNYNQKVYGMRHSVGAVDLVSEIIGTREIYPAILIGNSIKEVQAKIEQVVSNENQLDQIKNELMQARLSIDEVEMKFQQAQRKVELLQIQIQEMETSKFWKIRQGCIKLKKSLGWKIT